MPELADTLAERGKRYGDFTDHAQTAQRLQDVMQTQESRDGRRGWPLLSPVQKQALTVIADKIARILTGDPNYTDNWHDIQGYAKLAEERCVDASHPQLPLETAEAYDPSAAAHLLERQGDEYFCPKCTKRWAFDEPAPPCT